jgi:hypothetical protein
MAPGIDSLLNSVERQREIDNAWNNEVCTNLAECFDNWLETARLFICIERSPCIRVHPDAIARCDNANCPNTRIASGLNADRCIIDRNTAPCWPRL